MTIQLIDLLIITILQAAFNALLITCFIKWKWIEYGQIYAPKWMPFDCYDFCLPFWFSIIENILLYLLSPVGVWVFIICFFTPPITSKLLR